MSSSAISRLTSESPNLDDMLPRVVTLSNAIFLPDTTSKYASIVYWRTRLAEPASVILYLMATSLEGSDEPVAFLFAHSRTHTPPLHNGTTESLHIWLAGVLPDRRRGGLLGKLVEELSATADRRLTVCTYPSVFSDMWHWLQRREWYVERELQEGKVLLSKEAQAASVQAV